MQGSMRNRPPKRGPPTARPPSDRPVRAILTRAVAYRQRGTALPTTPNPGVFRAPPPANRPGSPSEPHKRLTPSPNTATVVTAGAWMVTDGWRRPVGGCNPGQRQGQSPRGRAVAAMSDCRGHSADAPRRQAGSGRRHVRTRSPLLKRPQGAGHPAGCRCAPSGPEPWRPAILAAAARHARRGDRPRALTAPAEDPARGANWATPPAGGVPNTKAGIRPAVPLRRTPGAAKARRARAQP